MNQEKIFSKQWCMAYLYIIIGSLIFAIGDVMFANPYILAPGGVYGLANVLNHVHPWEISNYSLCMDIPLLLIGTLILGLKFGVKTVVSIILIWAFVKGIENFWGYAPIIHNGIVDNPEEIPEFFKNSLIAFPDKAGKTVYFIPDYFLNTILTGAVYGIAIGLIFKSGATSGGSDIIAMIFHKYTKISLGTLVIVIDSLITLTTFLAAPKIYLPIYSIIVIVLEGWIIDLIVDGFKTYKTIFIVTDRYEEVRSFIINDMQRGGTCFLGTGMYAGKERHVIYTTLSRREYIRLRQQIVTIDPHAFINIISSNEIMGNGFKELK